MKKINNILKKRILILDGATGTELQRRGMPAGACPEIWGFRNPQLIKAVHADYCRAGSDIIYACTFGANRSKLPQRNIYNVREVNKQLVSLAREVAGGDVLIAGDIGPTGKFIEPFGSFGFEEAVGIFKEQVRGLLDGGVDLFVIETMMDIQEARAALIAVKEVTDKFTIVSMTYEEDGRTLNGTDPVTALITLQSLGADAVGCNCSSGPEQMLGLIERMKPYAKVPLAAKPNAGMPRLVAGKTMFDMEPGEFASFARKFASAGVNMLGGCCGTTPQYIKELKRKIGSSKPVGSFGKSVSAISSARRTVVIDKEAPLIVAGECINPTGKKRLQQELCEGKASLVRQLAKEQESHGADLLDVNVGVPGVDEGETLRRVVGLLSARSNLPLVIDSADPKAVEAALRIYPGRALINSISGEKSKLKKLFPIAAKYGAMFILLPLEGGEVPKDFPRRREIIKKVTKEAQKFGFTKNDIVVDAIAMTVSSNPHSALETIKTISWCSDVLKCSTIIGLSNISFGMPGRPWVNASFLAMARAKGLTMVIANPMSEAVMNVRRAQDILLGKDKEASLFFAHFTKASITSKGDLSPDERVFEGIIEGDKENIKSFVSAALERGITADKLVQNIMIPAINKVGDSFDRKEYFLPQLIASAETMKAAFEYLRPQLKKGKIESGKKTVIFLATVKGDIHDIGKNIVALMLRNHGFLVVDLGKDVSAKRIIGEIKQHKTPIVGLSALMTTTMVNMKEVIGMAKKEGLKCRFIVGGAAVTRRYARSLGAEYAQDSVEAVRVVKRLNSKQKRQCLK